MHQVNLWILIEKHFTDLSVTVLSSDQFIKSTALQSRKNERARARQHATHLYQIIQDQKCNAAHNQRNWLCVGAALRFKALQHTSKTTMAKLTIGEKSFTIHTVTFTQWPSHSDLRGPATYLRGKRNSRLAMLGKIKSEIDLDSTLTWWSCCIVYPAEGAVNARSILR